MTITVEFFGIPRERTGVASCQVEATTLSELLIYIGKRYPDFKATCLKNSELVVHTLANLNGKTFTRDSSTPLNDGDQVLILSADVGG